MTEIFAIVECKITFNDGSTEIRRPTFTEVSVGLASVDKVSVVNYLRDSLPDVQRVEIIDTLYFRNKTDYEKYMISL